MTTTTEQPIRHLQCACCGATTRGRQHWNRDTGFGLCERCADWILSRHPNTDMERTYGVRGFHYAIDEKGGVA